MKTFKVTVESSKADFFKQLISNLEFATVEEFHGMQPRINHEARMRENAPAMSQPSTKLSFFDDHEAGYKSIREVLTRIEERRTRHEF